MVNIEPTDLREWLSYDEKTGALTWKQRPIGIFPTARSGRTWNTRYAGAPAFASADDEGYHRITLGSRTWQAHRLAWAIYHGEWPEGQLDHINGDKSDNSIENLRVVSHAENSRNVKRSSANTSGVTGVSFYRQRSRWRATITVNRKHMSLGHFGSFDDAVAARKDAEQRFGFHSNHGRG